MVVVSRQRDGRQEPGMKLLHAGYLMPPSRTKTYYFRSNSIVGRDDPIVTDKYIEQQVHGRNNNHMQEKLRDDRFGGWIVARVIED